MSYYGINYKCAIIYRGIMMIKRLLCLLLAVLMCVSVFPAAAFADDEQETEAPLSDTIENSIIVSDQQEEAASEEESALPSPDVSQQQLDETEASASDENASTEEPEDIEEPAGNTEEAEPEEKSESEDPESEENQEEKEESEEKEEQEEEDKEKEEEKEAEEETESGIIYLFNPLIDGVYSQEEIIQKLQMPVLMAGGGSTMAIEPVENSYSDAQAALMLRAKMVSRYASFSVTVDNTAGVTVASLAKNIVYMAVQHTGNPKEGDYIGWQGLSCSYESNSSNKTVKFYFTMTYFSNYSQERTVDSQVSSLLASLNLSGKTDYQKIFAVYDYMAKNITYDYTNMNADISHTAYAALVNKTAVCQGYALLFYRLMLELGIDARVIVGYAAGGGHAWNIVALNGSYYYIDSTWDAGQYCYTYFLDGKTHFEQSHYPSAYLVNTDSKVPAADVSFYPISNEAYKLACSVSSDVSEVNLDTSSNKTTTIHLTFTGDIPASFGVVNTQTDCCSISILTNTMTKNGVDVKIIASSAGDAEVTFGIYDMGNNLSSSNICNVQVNVYDANTKKYTVAFDADGGENAPAPQIKYYGKQLRLTAEVPTRDGYDFDYWSTVPSSSSRSGTKYYAGGYYSTNANITLYARWRTNTEQVNFNANGGTCDVSSKDVEYRGLYGELPVPTRDGYFFAGWYTSAFDGEKITAETHVTRSSAHTLYAHWFEWTIEDGILLIPDQAELQDYTAGGAPWYSERENIIGVVFPDNLAYIGSNAFYGCSNISNITIPKTVTSIGAGAFSGCIGLQTISFTYLSPFTSGISTGLESLNATAYYHKELDCWSEEARSSISNTLNWTPFDDSHSTITKSAVEPTCTESGSTAAIVCTICEITLQEDTVLPKLGHDFGEDDICARCGTHRGAINYILGDERAENSANNPDKYTPGDTITLEAPTLTAYTFKGWYLDEELTEPAEAPQITEDCEAEMTFYAKWEPIAYTIKFSANSGSGSMSSLTKQTAETGKITIVNKFYRTGYEFAGWNTKSNGSGAQFDDVITVYELAPYAANNVITLYAQWQPISYKVFFESNGGTGYMSTMEFKYGTAQNLTANVFTKNGYVFSGWKCGSKTYKDEQSVKNLSSTNGAEIVLTAQWAAATYKISFDPNGGTGTVNPITVTYDKASSKLPTSGFKKTGWILKGWSTAPHADIMEYTVDYQSGVALTADQVDALYASRDSDNIVTLYAVWGPVEYKITYKNLPTYGKGSTEVSDNSMNPAKFCIPAPPKLSAPVVPGYTFEGWYTSSKLTTPVTDTFWTGAAKTVYAKLTPVTYSISYDLNGGTAPAKGNKTEYTIKTSITLNSPTRYGYTFAGWYLNGTKLTKLASGTYYGGDITLEARWTPNTYTLVLNGNGGTIDGAKTKTIKSLNTESSVTLPVLENRNLYKFEGWSTKSDATGDNYTAGAISVYAAKNKSTVTLYAAWSYQLTFDANGGEGTMESQTLFLNSSTKLNPGTFTKAGYYIAGWNTSQASANKGTIQYKDGASVKNLAGKTLYAVWKPCSYIIHFDANGGTGKMSNLTCTYNTAKTLTANAFKRSGYTFRGWSLESEATCADFNNKEKLKDQIVPEYNKQVITLYAVWN